MVNGLIISRAAYITIDKIVEFNNIRNQSTKYSRKFLLSLFRQFRIIQKFPFIGIQTDQENIYLLIWNSFYIYYMVDEALVQILSVHHQKENVRWLCIINLLQPLHKFPHSRAGVLLFHKVLAY